MSDLKTLAESPERCPYCGQRLQKGKLYASFRPALIGWIPLLTLKQARWEPDRDKLGEYIIKKRWRCDVDALCCRKCKKVIVSLPEEDRRKSGGEKCLT